MRFLGHILLVCVTFCGPVRAEEEAEATVVPGIRLTAPDLARTTSMDGLFTIYGGNAELRSQVYHAADETRILLYRALSMKHRKGIVPAEKGHIPIVVNLSDRFATRGQALHGRIAVMPDDSLSLQLSLATAGGWDRVKFKESLVRYLLVDLMLRRVQAGNLSASTHLDLPDWLHQGALELMNYYDHGRPTELFASVFRLGKTLTIEEILNADITSLDNVSMGIYRVSSCAFILMLLEQPDGVQTLLACIAGLPANQGTIAHHLEQFFPVLRGAPNQLEKWWSLALANYSERTSEELLTMLQSEEALVPLLAITYRTQPPDNATTKKTLAEKVTAALHKPTATATAAPDQPLLTTTALRDFPTILKRPDHQDLFHAQSDALIALSLRVHPFFRRVIAGYQEQLGKLAQGKDRGVAEALAGLEKKRATMLTDAHATEDYLDWYEATQRTHLSGKFTDYLNTAARLALPPVHRTDPITRYLDALEAEYK